MTEEPAPVVMLVVEDDPFVRELLVDVLLVEGYTFISTAHGAEALTITTQAWPKLVTPDLNLPGLSSTLSIGLND